MDGVDSVGGASPPAREQEDTEEGVIYNTVEECERLVSGLLAEGAPVAVDFEGINLARDGALCLIQVAPEVGRFPGHVALVDVSTLGHRCFGEGRLRELLESPRVLKIGFDPRADADALHYQFQTGLAPFWDVQVAYCRMLEAESAAKGSTHRDRFVKGLDKAISSLLQADPNRMGSMLQRKAVGKTLFCPELGGSYELWRDRPLHPELVAYSVVDVALLHEMRAAWSTPSLEEEMAGISAKRIKDTLEHSEPSRGRHKAFKDF